jgi:hypothetical protein
VKKILRTTLKFVAVALVILIPVELKNGWQFSSGLYWSFVGLNAENTVYDYLSSPLEKKLHFTNSMCNDGACLHKVDWRCGFTIDSLEFESENFMNWNEAVDSCFGKLAKAAPVYTSLDKLRKICGRHYMQFDPNQTGATQQACSEAEGKWGERITIYSDDEELLAKAKIEK